jgi:diguanylate cyclase (GGDEF)-like protein/PAS domain S-box-containing protein
MGAVAEATDYWFDRLPQGSEMAARIRALDWSRTPMGPIEAWPERLRVATAMCLCSGSPMQIAWGEDLVQVYNDAFIPILGEKHPQTGRRMSDTWPEVFDYIGPMLRGVLADREPVSADDKLLWVNRAGVPEDTYFSWSYTALLDRDGDARGILVTATETTGRVLDGRRLKALQELASATIDVSGADQAARAAAGALAAHPEDLPFLLIYRAGAAPGEQQLVAAAGIEPGGVLAPLTLRPLAGPWPDPAGASLSVPVPAEGAPEHGLSGQRVECARVVALGEYGLLVCGLSPTRRLDAAYLGWIDALASAIVRALRAGDTLTLERERADRLAEIDRAKTRFFENVSHELRTPLTLIRGPLAELAELGDPPLPPAPRAHVQIALRNTERLMRLVNALLDVARATEDDAAPALVGVDLPVLTRDIAALFEPAATAAGVRMSVECSPASAPVLSDPEAWEHIVVNLLSNALKFTPAGSIDIRLRAAGGRAELEVADTGVGIPAGEQERIFERFHRSTGGGARSCEGTGIGLALVRHLVRRLGGEVRAGATRGGGATFRVSVPAPGVERAHVAATTSRVATAAADEAGRWATPGPPPPRPDERPLILVVDDNADMREYLSSLLAERYRVHAVDGGQAALRSIQSELPGLVVSDVMMPRLDGTDLVRRLRLSSRTAAIPILLVSARAGEEAGVTGLSAGADDYIVKPFSARELLARVDGHLQLARMREALAQAEHERDEARRERLAQQRLHVAISASGTGIGIGGADERLTDVNPALCALLHRPARELVGMTVLELAYPEDLPLLERERARVLSGAADHMSVDMRLVRGDGEVAWVALEGGVVRDPTGTMTDFAFSIRDVGERMNAESRLRHLADHDALTGLRNRRRFVEDVDSALAEAHRYGGGGAVVLVDLDGLKAVNDRCGHAEGDGLLCAFAGLLVDRLRESDVVARLGGDEFALLLPRQDAQRAEAVATDVLHRLRQSHPLFTSGRPAQITASAGVAVLEHDGRWRTAEEILQTAGEALEEAKRAGGNCVRGASRLASRLVRPSWTERIRGALDTDAFELHTQPIVNLAAPEHGRQELLLRLRADGDRLLAPGTFLADAERSDLIREIDGWVLHRGIALLAEHQRAGRPVALHINLSARTITHPSAPKVIAGCLAEHEASGHGLVFEITETAAIVSIERARHFARAVRELGCALALDDFGTGFASFSYLRHLEFEFVKIDGDLVREIGHNLVDRRVLSCIANLTRVLGKRAIAECVGDEATLDVLRDHGVQYAQGYHLGMPRALAAVA